MIHSIEVWLRVIKRYIRDLIKRSTRGRLLLSIHDILRHLSSEGWQQSVITSNSIDVNGDPLPWYTYTFIEFLRERDLKSLSVFEYGSGNSTIWFSRRANEVVSVEHDMSWFKSNQQLLNGCDNVKLIHRNRENGKYSRAIIEFDCLFHIIIIDGRDRVNCAKQCLERLHQSGIIIWDNTEREKYCEGVRQLLDLGFKKIDFWGIGPINSSKWCTSIFYRSNNCLNI